MKVARLLTATIHARATGSVPPLSVHAAHPIRERRLTLKIDADAHLILPAARFSGTLCRWLYDRLKLLEIIVEKGNSGYGIFQFGYYIPLSFPSSVIVQ